MSKTSIFFNGIRITSEFESINHIRIDSDGNVYLEEEESTMDGVQSTWPFKKDEILTPEFRKTPRFVMDFFPKIGIKRIVRANPKTLYSAFSKNGMESTIVKNEDGTLIVERIS